MTKALKYLLFLLLFPLCNTFAQTDSAAKHINLKIFQQKDFIAADSFITINNSLDNLHNYLPKFHLGNSGLPFIPLNPQHHYNTGFIFRPINSAQYFYSPNNLLYYNTKTPFSDLLYITGTKREQLFKMTFAYNVSKNWNFSVDFSRIRSEGFYTRQNTNNNSFAVSSNYTSNNKRYKALFGIIYNSIENAENGGIADDSLLESSGSGQSLIDVNLSDADNSHHNRTVFIKQYLNLGNYSSDTSDIPFIIPSSTFILSSTYDDHLLEYTDENPLSGYYSQIYYDSTRTYDSTFYFKIENELEWVRLDNRKHRGLQDMLGLGFGLKHQFLQLKQRETDSTFNNIIATAQVFNTYSNNSFFWKIKGQYAVTGINADDYNFSFQAKKNLGDSTRFLALSATADQHEPDFIFNRYSSNHFKWTNNFDKISELNASLYFALLKYRSSVGIAYSVFSNVTYFDNYATAKQYSGTIPVLSAYLKKDFSLWNWHLNNKVTYQDLPDSMVIRLPELILEHSLYYENDVFKKAMKLQVGAQLTYASGFYGNSYMPATMQFYLQNEKQIGNYPFIDLFLNAQIRMVRVFIKVDHVNAGLSGTQYLQAPGYPLSGRTFKLGVSWRFYD